MIHTGCRYLVLTTAIVLAVLLPVAARATPAIDERFRDYYEQYQGLRVLGYPLTELVTVDGHPAQYFEKGRIEDHGSRSSGVWRFLYGRLTAELIERDPAGSVNNTSITYGDLAAAHAPAHRHDPPLGFRGGTARVAGGTFVPFDAQLQPAPGYIVAPMFWSYINRTDLFPAGWLHDIGLPMTDAFVVETYKEGERRDITIQAFERSVLTYDPMNPPEWQIERGNIGADALRTLGAGPRNPIEIPAREARVTLPLHILMRAGEPGERVSATLRWQDGTELSNEFVLLRGEDGRGLLIGNLDWVNMLQPPEPATQRARLEVRSATGELLGNQVVMVLSPNDPDTRPVDLYWVISGAERVGPQQRQVVRTPQIGTAALEELLWGPPATSQIGYQTAIPTPEEVLNYPGREADWGPRVTLRSLTIVDGVATADFSQELNAYGGGALRVQLIRDQITRTLLQFPTVREVRIAIEGQVEGALQP